MTNMSISRLGRIFAALIILMFLAGCSGLENKEEMPAEDLAKKGLEQYNRGKYFLAVETFNIIKERFPFSRFSLLAELKAGDCEFYMKDYVESLELYEEFEKNHPANEAIPYVLFQIGRSHYRTIDTIDRDTTGAREAIKAFTRLLRTFPNSPYTEEAKVLTQKSNNFLAEHELYVANFYLRTKEFGQAKGRVEYLLRGYPDSPAATQAKELRNKIEAAEKMAGE
jgi:outer membrane protein assembly factor BamD